MRHVISFKFNDTFSLLAARRRLPGARQSFTGPGLPGQSPRIRSGTRTGAAQLGDTAARTG